MYIKSRVSFWAAQPINQTTMSYTQYLQSQRGPSTNRGSTQRIGSVSQGSANQSSTSGEPRGHIWWSVAATRSQNDVEYSHDATGRYRLESPIRPDHLRTIGSALDTVREKAVNERYDRDTFKARSETVMGSVRRQFPHVTFLCVDQSQIDRRRVEPVLRGFVKLRDSELRQAGVIGSRTRLLPRTIASDSSQGSYRGS